MAKIGKRQVQFENLDNYTSQFQKLRVDTSKGPAPHKPILLLSVIDLIEAEIFPDNYIFLNPELVKQFSNNWSLLVTSERHKPIKIKSAISTSLTLSGI